MSGEITRPPSIEVEARRLAKEMIDRIHDDAQYKIKVAENIADIKASIAMLNLLFESHERSDRANFEELKKQYTNVSSSVGQGEKLVARLDGVKLAIGAVLATLVVIGGWVIAMIGIFQEGVAMSAEVDQELCETGAYPIRASHQSSISSRVHNDNSVNKPLPWFIPVYVISTAALLISMWALWVNTDNRQILRAEIQASEAREAENQRLTKVEVRLLDNHVNELKTKFEIIDRRNK